MDGIMVRIGFGMRLVAGLIDGVVMLGAGWLLSTIILKIVGLNTAGIITARLAAGWLGLAYACFEIVKAASPGKMMLKYQITMADGSPAPKDVLVKRWAIKQAPTFLQIAAAVTTLSLFHWVALAVALAIVVGCF